MTTVMFLCSLNPQQDLLTICNSNTHTMHLLASNTRNTPLNKLETNICIDSYNHASKSNVGCNILQSRSTGTHYPDSLPAMSDCAEQFNLLQQPELIYCITRAVTMDAHTTINYCWDLLLLRDLGQCCAQWTSSRAKPAGTECIRSYLAPTRLVVQTHYI